MDKQPDPIKQLSEDIHKRWKAVNSRDINFSQVIEQELRKYLNSLIENNIPNEPHNQPK